MLGVVENMAGLRQRADAFRFTLPGVGGQQSNAGGGSAAASEERDVTEQVLAALRQVAPDLEVRTFLFCALSSLCRCLQHVSIGNTVAGNISWGPGGRLALFTTLL